MFELAVVTATLSLRGADPPAVPDSRRDPPASKDDSIAQVSRSNAELALRSFSDQYLSDLRAAVLRLQGSPDGIDQAVRTYQERREVAIRKTIALYNRDPGGDIIADDIRRTSQDWPRGEPWDPAKAEEEQRRTRELEEEARRATEEAGIPAALLEVGKEHSDAVITLCSSVRDIIGATGNIDASRRMHWLLVSACIDAENPHRGPTAAFVTDVNVFTLWRTVRARHTDAPKSDTLLVMDPFGLPIGGPDDVLQAVDDLLERSATVALLRLRSGHKDDVDALQKRAGEARVRRWAAQDRLVDALAIHLRSLALTDFELDLRAHQLRILAPTIVQQTWIERDAGAILDSLHATGAIDAEQHSAAVTQLGEAKREIGRLREALIANGLAVRKAAGTPDGKQRRADHVDEMLRFDEFVAAAKRQLLASLPPSWQERLPAQMRPRAEGATANESCLDPIAKRQMER